MTPDRRVPDFVIELGCVRLIWSESSHVKMIASRPTEHRPGEEIWTEEVSPVVT